MALFCFGDILAWGNLEWDCFGMGLFHIESADKDCYKCEFPHILAIALGFCLSMPNIFRMYFEIL